MVELTKEEKRQMCVELTKHLPRIRQLLCVTQAEFGNLCGFSRFTASQLETGNVQMTWQQLIAIMFACTVNARAKEFFYANNILGPRFLQFMQRKDENIPPDVNIQVKEELIMSYDGFLKFYEDYKAAQGK